MYVPCESCKGSGLQDGSGGWPTDCYSCRGQALVLARDTKGRFVGAATEEGNP